MADQGTDLVYRRAAAGLCQHLDWYAEKLVDAEHLARWRELVAALAQASAGTDAWRQALTDLDELATACGLPGIGLPASRASYGVGTPPGTAPGPGWQPVRTVEGWLCPRGACARVELPQGPYVELPPGPPCALFDVPMVAKSV